MEHIELAKAIAIHLGINGRGLGGWLYDHKGKVVCQGWFAYMQLCKQRGWIVNRRLPFLPCINWRKVPNPPWGFFVQP